MWVRVDSHKLKEVHVLKKPMTFSQFLSRLVKRCLTVIEHTDIKKMQKQNANVQIEHMSICISMKSLYAKIKYLHFALAYVLFSFSFSYSHIWIT